MKLSPDRLDWSLLLLGQNTKCESVCESILQNGAKIAEQMKPLISV